MAKKLNLISLLIVILLSQTALAGYDEGYEWAEGYGATDFSECQYEFGTGEEEDGCNAYVRENQYGGAHYFKGYECTEDCSGHEAGYEWAEDNGITDEYDCNTYSTSFDEGCRVYVEENY